MWYNSEVNLVGGFGEPATKDYIEDKIKTLEELCIPLSESTVNKLYSLETEVQVDNFIHDLIVRKDIY